MLGGYNVQPLIDLLDDAQTGPLAAAALSKTLLIFDAFHDIQEKADSVGKPGNAHAKKVLQSWADAEWFTSRPEVPQSLTVTIFKVTGETNTDDLSPAPDAWSRPDIAACAGHAEESASGDRRRRARQDRRGQADQRAQGQGPPGSLCRRRGRHRLLAQVRHQLGAVVHRRGHSLRAEQAFRRRLPGRQDRADLLQHHGRRRRAADRARHSENGHGRRRRAAPLRGKTPKEGK